MSTIHADALPEVPQATTLLLPFRLARGAMAATLQQLLLWQERANQRHHLSMIDGHALRDVGLTRADLAPEIRKPFWRP